MFELYIKKKELDKYFNISLRKITFSYSLVLVEVYIVNKNK